MLNSKSERELAYLVLVDKIEPIPGRDKVEAAYVGGWSIMVRKGVFKPGSIGVYFEIDSRVPETEPFMFLAGKHFKIKTQKYKTPEGHFYSQGLLMAPEDFGWESYVDGDGSTYVHFNGKSRGVEGDERFLTKELGVTYADIADNSRKAGSQDKYKIMAQRNYKLFKHQPFRWLMRREWGRKLLFLAFGKKKDKKSGWPVYVARTNEERIQNMTWVLTREDKFTVTEKLDGSSTTFTMARANFGKYDYKVCSRNVVFDKPDKKCFYDSNIYLEMSEKYGVEEKLKTFLLNHPEEKWITVQGETYGAGVQRRDYSLKDEREFAAFNLVTSSKGRWNSKDAEAELFKLGIPFVPILDYNFTLKPTVEEMLEIAAGESEIDGLPREGLVIRAANDGNLSFKVIDNEFLLKYHG